MPSRRSALIALAITTVALGGFLLAIDPSTVDGGNASIVDFEFAGSESAGGEILDDWGDEGQDAARLSLWVDFLYLASYGAFGALAAAATRDLARRRGWRRLAAFGGAAIIAAVGAACFDALEDVWLLIALGRHGGDLAPLLATICASLKFLLSAAVIAYLVAGLLMRLHGRGSAAS
jgi:hypothetical protein